MSITDHYPIFISISQSKDTQQNMNNFIKFRNINDESTVKFESELEKLFEDTIRHIDEAPRAFTLFYMSLNELYEKYFPIIIKPVKNKEIINPWVTPALAKCINIRHNLGRLASKGRVDNNIYKRFRNKVTIKLREAKKEYYSNKFNNSKGDMKKNMGYHK